MAIINGNDNDNNLTDSFESDTINGFGGNRFDPDLSCGHDVVDGGLVAIVSCAMRG